MSAIQDVFNNTPGKELERVKSERRALLEEVIDLIDGDRNKDYGEPIDDFSQTAIFIQTYLDGIVHQRGRLLILPHDVAVIQTFVKLSRLVTSPAKKDHWADISGYAACGYDTVVAQQDAQAATVEGKS